MKIEKEKTLKELQEQVNQLESTISSLMNFISLKGDSFSIKAKGKLTLEALNIQARASSEVKIEGGASTEVSSNGITTIKGSMVQIN